MRCANCGTFLRPEDRFCSQCGAPVDGYGGGIGINELQQTDETEYPDEAEESGLNDYVDEPSEAFDEYEESSAEDPLYDTHVFRDSFLDKTEEGHHAFLVTLTILLVIATVTVGGVFLYAYLRQRSGPSNSDPPAQQDILILSEGEAALDNGAGIMPQTETPAQPDDSAQAGTEEVSQAEPVQETQAQTSAETETAAQAESTAAAQGGPDIAEIVRIMEAEATAEQYGIYIYDLNGDRSYAVGESEAKLYASATVTVPILYTAAVQLSQGAVTFNDLITYVNSIGGRGEPYPSQRNGNAYPLSYYLTTMLTYSDNNCINCLIDFFGLQNINSTCRAAGFESVDLQRKIVENVTDGAENYVSARDLALMVKELYNGKFAAIGRDFMLQNFRITEDDAYSTLIGQSEGLPASVTLLNQNGRGDTRYAETAVILDDTHSYIISVMCTGAYGYAYEEAVKHISEYVYSSLG